MQKREKIANAVLLLIVFSLGSKFLGFFREVLIAAKFGSGVETDTFFIALTAVALFKVMVTSSINTTMIPVLSKLESIEGKRGKKRQVNNFLNIVIIISLIIIFIGWILSPFIIKLVAFGFKGEQIDLAIDLFRIGLFIILFSGIVGVFRSYLQSEYLFKESALADLPFNFVYILFLIFLSDIYGIKGLMVASVLAVGSQFLIQIPSLRKLKFRYNFYINFNNNYIRQIVHLIPPVLLSVSINDLNNVVDRSLASTLIEGSVSALNYGNRLTNFVQGVFIAAITTVLFPLLSNKAQKQSNIELKEIIRRGANTIILITFPATVGLIVLAEPLVKVAFQRGEFTANDTYMTMGAMVFYSLGLAGMSLRLLFDKVYFSLQDTKTPLINTILTVGLNIILNFVLINFMAHRGLALATSISTTITTIFLIYLLQRKIGSLGLFEVMKCALKSFVAALVMGVVLHNIYKNFYSLIQAELIFEILFIFISISIGVIIYFALIHLFKVKEVVWLWGKLKSKKK